jgi:hypothetical protein
MGYYNPSATTSEKEKSKKRKPAEGLIAQPDSDSFDKAPTTQSKKRKRAKGSKEPVRPSSKSDDVQVETPESERSRGLSEALMKGAAVVPNFSGSGALRGLLSGASVGMDIDNALSTYKRRNRQASLAAAAADAGGST